MSFGDRRKAFGNGQKGIRKHFSGIKVKTKKGAFNFHYEVYGKKYGEEIKNVFKELPPQLKTSSDYQPHEEIYPECKEIETLAPCHEYNLKAHGSVEGPIDVLLLFYKKIQEYELIKKDPIILHFEN